MCEIYLSESGFKSQNIPFFVNIKINYLHKPPNSTRSFVFDLCLTVHHQCR
jgi:hypothetical protein